MPYRQQQIDLKLIKSWLLEKKRIEIHHLNEMDDLICLPEHWNKQTNQSNKKHKLLYYILKLNFNRWTYLASSTCQVHIHIVITIISRSWVTCSVDMDLVVDLSLIRLKILWILFFFAFLSGMNDDVIFL